MTLFKFLALLFVLLWGQVQGQLQDTTVVLKKIDSLLSLSTVMMDRGLFDSSDMCLRQSARLATDGLPKDHLQLANIKHRLGFLHYVNQKPNDAKLYYLEALRIKRLRLSGQDPSIALTLNNLGIIYEIEGNLTAAEGSYLEARTMWAASLGKEHERYGWVQHNLGKLYERTGRDDEAITCLAEALRIKEAMLDPENPELGHTMVLMASIYLRKGNYPAYELYTIRAADIWKKQKGINDLLYYWSRHNLANLHEYYGNYPFALELSKEALKGKQEILGPNDPDVALTLITMANIYSGMGQRDSTRICLETAKDIYEHAGDPFRVEYAWVLNNLGLNALYLMDFQASKGYLSRSLEIKEKVIGTENLDYSTTVINYAASLIRTGSLDSASLLLVRQKAFYDYNQLTLHRNYTYLLDLMSDIDVLREEPLDALEKLERINQINQELVSMIAEFASEQELLAYLHQAQNQLDKYLSLAFSLHPEQVDETGDLYNHVIFYKGFVLDRYMEIRSQITWDDESMPTYRALSIEKRKLAEAYTSLLADRKDIKPIKEEINRLEKELAGKISADAHAMDWKEIQKVLLPDEAVVEFVAYQQHDPYPADSTLYGALVITPGAVAPSILPLEKVDAVLSRYQSLKKDDQSLMAKMYSGNTQELYGTIWKPLESSLSQTKKVYFAPAGLLHRIHFKAIPVDEHTLLGEKYELVQLVSTRQLQHRDTNVSFQRTCVIMGAIEYEVDSLIEEDRGEAMFDEPVAALSRDQIALRGGTWNKLKGSENEVNAISPILTQASFHLTVYKDREATEENFKALSRSQPQESSPQIIHLSTHGYFFPDPVEDTDSQAPGAEKGGAIRAASHPMIRSGLILAGGNYYWQTGMRYANAKEDGILTAYEISLMDLSDTELVVLSACETGLGDIEGNEGVYGLQRAFKIAGVKNLIMSLWKVPDAATAELMTRFYRNWMEDKLTIRAALQSAQASMRAEGWEAYYWAGFILVE